MIKLGGKVRIRVRFRNAATGVLTDPTSVYFRIKRPDGTVESYQLGLDPEVVRESAGTYTYTREQAEQSLRWFFEAEGTGDLVATIPGAFDVMRSVFSPGV